MQPPAFKTIWQIRARKWWGKQEQETKTQAQTQTQFNCKLLHSKLFGRSVPEYKDKDPEKDNIETASCIQNCFTDPCGSMISWWGKQKLLLQKLDSIAFVYPSISLLWLFILPLKFSKINLVHWILSFSMYCVWWMDPARNSIFCICIRCNNHANNNYEGTQALCTNYRWKCHGRHGYREEHLYSKWQSLTNAMH